MAEQLESKPYPEPKATPAGADATRAPQEAATAGPAQPDSFIPENRADEAGDNSLILVPVTAEDVTREKRRKVIQWGLLLLVLLAIVAWYYKRVTDPVRAQQSFDAAQRLFAVARYNEAIVACDRAISLKTNFADAYMLRGRARVLEYDAAEAIADFAAVIEIRPGDPQALLWRAAAYVDQKKYTPAISDAAAALKLDSKLARAYYLRGTALRGLGEARKAIEEFAQAAELEPSTANYVQLGATYQLVGDHRSAIQSFTQAILMFPDAPEAYFARAQSERALGDTEQATKDYLEGRRLDVN